MSYHCRSVRARVRRRSRETSARRINSASRVFSSSLTDSVKSAIEVSPCDSSPLASGLRDCLDEQRVAFHLRPRRRGAHGLSSAASWRVQRASLSRMPAPWPDLIICQTPPHSLWCRRVSRTWALTAYQGLYLAYVICPT